MAKGRTNATKTGGWRRWVTWAGLVIAVGVMVWMAGYVRKNVDVGAVLTKIHPVWLLCAVLVVPVVELVDTLVFYSMGRRSGQNVSFFGCFAATFVGELYYRLGPAGAPVQLGMMVDGGFEPVAAGSVYTWKSLANAVVYTVLGLAALGCKVGLFGEKLGWVAAVVTAVLGGYVALCVLGFLAAARPLTAARVAQRCLTFLTPKIPFFQHNDRGRRAEEKIEEYCAALGQAWEDQELLWRMFLGVFVELLLLFSIPAYLYFGLGLHGVSFLRITLTTCLVMLLARLVALPGNAVGAEGAFYLLMFPYFGGRTTAALVLWRVLTFAWPMALGAGVSLVTAARNRSHFSFSS